MTLPLAPPVSVTQQNCHHGMVQTVGKRLAGQAKLSLPRTRVTVLQSSPS